MTSLRCSCFDLLQLSTQLLARLCCTRNRGVKQNLNQRTKAAGGNMAITQMEEQRSSTRKENEWRPEGAGRISAVPRTQITDVKDAVLICSEVSKVGNRRSRGQRPTRLDTSQIFSPRTFSPTITMSSSLFCMGCVTLGKPPYYLRYDEISSRLDEHLALLVSGSHVYWDQSRPVLGKG